VPQDSATQSAAVHNTGITEAGKPYYDEPVCETIVAGQANGDCRIDCKDFAAGGFTEIMMRPCIRRLFSAWRSLSGFFPDDLVGLLEGLRRPLSG